MCTSLALLLLALGDIPERDEYFVRIEVQESASAKAFLGARMLDYERDEVHGALVQEVVRGSSAEKAGLATGDVILQIGRQPIRTTRDVIQQIDKRRAGDRVALQVLRGGKRVELPVELAGRPSVRSLLVQRDPPRNGGGTIRFGGTISGDVESAGNYVIAGNPTVGGSFTLHWTGVMDVELDCEAKTGLKVGGDAKVEGLLHIGLAGRKPRLGERFEIIRDAKSLRGRFDEVMLPKLDEGLAWRLEYDDLSAGADLDHDGKADLTLSVTKAEK